MKKKAESVVQPRKRHLNMAKREQRGMRPARLISLLAVLLAGLLAFGKVAVADRLAAVRGRETEAADLQSENDALRRSLSESAGIEHEYLLKSRDWMPDEMKQIPACGKVLDLVEREMMPLGQIKSIATSGNLLSVELNGIDLNITSGLVETLYDLPEVRDVKVFQASSESPSVPSAQVTLLVTLGEPDTAGGDQT